MQLTPPVVFDDLEVGYDQNIVLHGISATISSGSCVAITGDNGSGKSTLLKALMGIVPHNAGKIELFGQTLSSKKTPDPKITWREIGYVPQRVNVGGGISSTVQEVVATGLLEKNRLWLSKGSKAKVKQILEQVGLAHRASEAFHVLSGGQQQRALIARALVRQPSLLLLDEPLTGLDAHNRQILADLIASHKKAGSTSIIVLHELGELYSSIDRELRISAGHLVHDGPCTHDSHDASPHHLDNSHAASPATSPRLDFSVALEPGLEKND